MIEVAAVISRELDRQERISRRPDYEIGIGKLNIRVNLGKPLADHEIKCLTASQVLTDYLLEVSNPFGEFEDYDNDIEPDCIWGDRPDDNRLDLFDFS